MLQGFAGDFAHGQLRNSGINNVVFSTLFRHTFFFFVLIPLQRGNVVAIRKSQSFTFIANFDILYILRYII